MKPDKKKSGAADPQAAPPRKGQVDSLAGPMPDGIPMTGEEDPLAEVDDAVFAPVVAEFVASERAQKAQRGGRDAPDAVRHERE